MNALLKTAFAAANKAAKIIQKSYGKVLAIENKNPLDVKDFVTHVDREVEEIIRAEILAKFPDHGIWGEEYGKAHVEREYVWVIDPIDGTKNFTHGLGQFAISIGLLQNKKPYLGVLHNPIDNQTTWGIDGKGAYAGKKKLLVSKTNNLQESSIAINFGKTEEIRKKSLHVIEILYHDVPIIRMPGSTAFAVSELAQGKYDAVVDNGDYWDFAAALVIVKEAGGMATNWQGNVVKEAFEFVLWSNGVLHKKLQEKLAKILI